MKTVHALGRVATVIGNTGPKSYKIKLKDIKSLYLSIQPNGGMDV
jgi:hypothetical protein